MTAARRVTYLVANGHVGATDALVRDGGPRGGRELLIEEALWRRICAASGLPALPMTRRCVVCGCTDEAACPGGCAWATAELCTACSPLVGP